MQPNVSTKQELNEYRVVLVPPPVFQEKVRRIKSDFSAKYRTAFSAHAACMSLVYFKQFNGNEDMVIRKLAANAAKQRPLRIEMNDFGSYPTHSIFIDTGSKKQVQKIVDIIRPLQHLMKTSKENKPHFITGPHINIAKKLLPWQYEQAWSEYEYLHFSGSFIAAEVSLLKKAPSENFYHTVGTFAFLGEPEKIVQPELFI